MEDQRQNCPLTRLTEKEVWGGIYAKEIHEGRSGLWQRLRPYLPRDGFPQLIACLLRRQIRTFSEGGKILEIGCAPAHWLVSLAGLLKMTPYGLDYSAEGCEIARQTFLAAGYPVENIIHGDFFDDSFISSIRVKFDIVCSFGFIEHFDDLHGVLRRHIPLVKDHGWLCVTMPNLLYLNRLFLPQEILDRHYLPSMQGGVLKKTMLRTPGLRLAWAGYFGGFELRRTFPFFYVPFFTTAWQRFLIDPPVRLLTSLGICPNLPYIAPHIGAIAQRV